MRPTCFQCRRPLSACFCQGLPRLEVEPRFVILIHPKEARKGIGTGRMTHLALPGSYLLEGESFASDPRVQALIEDPAHQPFVLFPGPSALDLSTARPEDLGRAMPPGRRPLIFVIDGTWPTARRMIRPSPNLLELPQLRFTPERLSGYRIRQQPKAHCFSTIEAVHAILSHLHRLGRCPLPESQARMLEPFEAMVRFQERCEEEAQARRRKTPGASSAVNSAPDPSLS